MSHTRGFTNTVDLIVAIFLSKLLANLRPERRRSEYRVVKCKWHHLETPKLYAACPAYSSCCTLMATITEQLTPTQIFKRQWENYQVLLDEDYLEHRALYGSLQNFMQQKAGPLRLLDLGCGDSDYISRIILKAGGDQLVESYTGVDLSEPAIEISKQNVRRVMKGAAQWHTADFLSFTKGCFEDFDCILMSFAMHHLKADAKAEILKECYRLLKNRNGAFVMVDIVRKPDESLAAFHERSQRDVETNWVALRPEVRASFTEHMLKFDFPETISALEQMGTSAGFRSVKSVHTASKGISHVVVMES